MMKEKKKSIFIISIFLVSIFSISVYGTYFIAVNNFSSETSFQPITSDVYTINYIFIDGSVPGNWSDTASMYPWCSGSGIESDPYVIENCIINASGSPTGQGILIQNSKSAYYEIRNCTITDADGVSEAGIKVQNSSRGLIVNNTLINNNDGIFLYEYTNDTIISSNSIFRSSSGINLNSYCERNLVSNNFINNSYSYGIELRFNHDTNIITDNTIGYSQSNGILSLDTNYTIFSGNLIYETTWTGLSLGYSYHCNISNNIIRSNHQNGIYFQDSDFNLISQNTIENNDDDGFTSQLSHYNELFRNHIRNNGQNGIELNSFGYGYIVHENLIEGHLGGSGVYILNDIDDSLVYNNLIYNNSAGIKTSSVESNDNVIYRNRLVLNKDNGVEVSSSNDWDNGIVGNYWSDYTGVDNNGDGIGDTPYNITGMANEKDDFPLMNMEPFFFNSPKDMDYEEGTTGHGLDWEIFDFSPFLKAYSIYRDGILIQSDSLYEQRSTIKINVDGLQEGSYIYTLVISDGFNDVSSDIVIVNVYSEDPLGEGNTNSANNQSQELMEQASLALVIGAIIVAMALVSLGVLVNRRPLREKVRPNVSKSKSVQKKIQKK